MHAHYLLVDALLARGYHPTNIALALSLHHPEIYRHCVCYDLPTNRRITARSKTARLIRRQLIDQLWTPEEVGRFYRQSPDNIRDIAGGHANRRTFILPPKPLIAYLRRTLLNNAPHTGHPGGSA